MADGCPAKTLGGHPQSTQCGRRATESHQAGSTLLGPAPHSQQVRGPPATELPGSATTVRPRVGAEIAETLERRAVINLLDYILDLFRDEAKHRRSSPI